MAALNLSFPSAVICNRETAVSLFSCNQLIIGGIVRLSVPWRFVCHCCILTKRSFHVGSQAAAWTETSSEPGASDRSRVSLQHPWKLQLQHYLAVYFFDSFHAARQIQEACFLSQAHLALRPHAWQTDWWPSVLECERLKYILIGISVQKFLLPSIK